MFIRLTQSLGTWWMSFGESIALIRRPIDFGRIGNVEVTFIKRDDFNANAFGTV